MCKLTIEKIGMVKRAELLKAELKCGNGAIPPGEKVKMLREIAQLMKAAGSKKEPEKALAKISELLSPAPMPMKAQLPLAELIS